MIRFYVTFDLHEPEQPPGNLYSGIWGDIERHFGSDNYVKDFLQFCLVRSDRTVSEVKEIVRKIVDRRSNHFHSRDVIVFTLGDEISIARRRPLAGKETNQKVSEFRKFFVTVDET